MHVDVMSGDTFDIRDVIERFEKIEDALEDDEFESFTEEDFGEAATIKEFLDEMAGKGGDEQWRGDWYPSLFIADDYFKEYAEQLADDIGAINKDASWPTNCIDWDEAASQLQGDYSSVDVNGTTYWFR